MPMSDALCCCRSGNHSSDATPARVQGDRLLCLDPHSIQPTDATPGDPSSHTPTDESTLTVPFTAIDSTMALGFFCADAAALADLGARIAALSGEFRSAPLLSVGAVQALPPEYDLDGDVAWDDDGSDCEAAAAEAATDAATAGAALSADAQCAAGDSAVKRHRDASVDESMRRSSEEGEEGAAQEAEGSHQTMSAAADASEDAQACACAGLAESAHALTKQASGAGSGVSDDLLRASGSSTRHAELTERMPGSDACGEPDAAHAVQPRAADHATAHTEATWGAALQQGPAHDAAGAGQLTQPRLAPLRESSQHSNAAQPRSPPTSAARPDSPAQPSAPLPAAHAPAQAHTPGWRAAAGTPEQGAVPLVSSANPEPASDQASPAAAAHAGWREGCYSPQADPDEQLLWVAYHGAGDAPGEDHDRQECAHGSDSQGCGSFFSELAAGMSGELPPAAQTPRKARDCLRASCDAADETVLRHALSTPALSDVGESPVAIEHAHCLSRAGSEIERASAAAHSGALRSATPTGLARHAPTPPRDIVGPVSVPQPRQSADVTRLSGALLTRASFASTGVGWELVDSAPGTAEVPAAENGRAPRFAQLLRSGQRGGEACSDGGHAVAGGGIKHSRDGEDV